MSKTAFTRLANQLELELQRKEYNIYEIKQMFFSLKTKLKNLPDDQEKMLIFLTDEKDIDYTIDLEQWCRISWYYWEYSDLAIIN